MRLFVEASIICFDLPCTVFSECLPSFLCFAIDSILYRFNLRFLVFKFIFCFIVTVGNHFVIRLGALLKCRF